jgi:hypothetical protein
MSQPPRRDWDHS